MSAKVKQEDSTVRVADRLLLVMLLALQTSRNRFERELIKGLLLKAGVTRLSNKTNRNFAIREEK